MKKYQLPNGVIGSHLCKYYSVNDFLLDTIENSRMWFADPTGFNDPYDCNLDFTVNLNDDWCEELIREAQIKGGLGAEIDSFVEALRKNSEAFEEVRRTFERLERQNIRKEIGRRGIACFSRSEFVFLLWSHYADKHAGVCLKFDISQDEEFFKAPYKVEYPNGMPRYNIIDLFRKLPHTGLIQHVLATKSKEWEYEQEVRVVKWDKFGPFRGLISFNPRALIEVCFGYRMTPEDKATVCRLLDKDCYSHVERYDMRLRMHEFGLEKQPLLKDGS